MKKSVLALFVLLLATLGGAQTIPAAMAAATYQYNAETAAPARRQGVVSASGTNWNCQGSLCTTSGLSATPEVSACHALAQQVGPVRSYGHKGGMLTPGELKQCNTGVATGQPTPFARGAQPITPLSGTPPPAPGTPSSAALGLKPLTNADTLTRGAQPAAPPLGAPSPPLGAPSLGTPPPVLMKAPSMTVMPGPSPAKPSPATPSPATPPSTPQSMTAPALQGGIAGAPAGPAINGPAARQLTTINPALTRQLGLRTESFTSLKREVERRRAVAEAEARRLAAEREAEASRREGPGRNRGGSGRDCDDSRADVYAGAAEICDLVDNNCNGSVDEGVTLPRYLDADGDGHGSASLRVNVCPSEISARATQAEAGTAPWLVELGNDCDDSNPDVWRNCP
ncbi:MAG: MopE-related protein [Gammaproteobacteria bacterium]|nr:MopE-related protein [Gammaproteobacteria bacterium]